MSKHRWLFLIIGMLFATIGFYFSTKHAEHLPPKTLAVGGEILWQQSLITSTGDLQTLSIWKNYPLVVNFWATWCTPCIEEMPELSALQTEIAQQTKVQIIGIAIDSADNVAKFTAKYRITYPLYIGGVSGTDLSRQLGNEGGGLPFTVLIDRNGEIKKTYLGRLDMHQLRKDLNLL